MLGSAKQLLEENLPLGLHEALHHSLFNPIDDFSGVTPGKSFLDDP